MDIKDMNMEQIEARMEEIKQELMGDCDVKALTKEVDALEERRDELQKEIVEKQFSEEKNSDLNADISPELVKEKTKPQKKKSALIVIAIVVVVAIIAIAAFLISGNDSEESSQSNQTTEDSSSDKTSESESKQEDANKKEATSDGQIVLNDTDKYSVSITNYDDKTGEFTVKIVNKTKNEISCYSDGELLDGKEKCIADTEGTESFAYTDVLPNDEITVFSSFRPSNEDNYDKIYKLSDNHTFECKMNVADNSDNADDFWEDSFKVKLTPDMFGY